MLKKAFLAGAGAAISLSAGVFAQSCNFDLKYDCNRVKQIFGQVVMVINYNPGSPLAGPQSIIVSCRGQIYNVFLGPGCFNHQIGFDPKVGDVVSAAGSQRMVCGGEFIVASKVQRNNFCYSFRTEKGEPLWAVTASNSPAAADCAPVGAGPGGYEPVPFDCSSVVTIEGKIIRARQQLTQEGCEPSLILTLSPYDSCSSDVIVLLGPSSFLSQSGLCLGTGSWVSVTGSLVDTNLGRTVVATTVQQRQINVRLRDSYGAPLFPN